jgi:hypothetical protein
MDDTEVFPTVTAEALVGTGIKSISLEAVVIRADGTREDLGTIAYWHKNPLRRFLARLRGQGRIKH